MKSDKRMLDRATNVANIILGRTGVVCLLVLFYFVYHYSLAGERQFTSPVGVIVYYVFPALLAGLFLTSLRLAPAHRINLSLFVIALSISIYMVELLVPSPKPVEEYARKGQKLARQFGRSFDTRSRLEVIDDLRQKGIDAYIAITPRALINKAEGGLKPVITIDGTEVLPMSGISSKVSVLSCNENGYYPIYEADEYGFHNPKGIWNNGHIDIAAVGDSFTHGYCVPSDKHFVALIRKRYPATLNLGGASNGPLLMLATIKEYEKHIKPKILLWVYYENDLDDLTQEKKNPLLMRYMERDFDQGLLNRQTAIDFALAAYFEAMMKEKKLSESHKVRNLKSIMKLSNLRYRFGLVYGESLDEIAPEPIMRLFRDVLLEAKKIVSLGGGKLYFIYLPGRNRYATPETVNVDRDRVLELVKEIGLPVIDIHKAFLAHGDPLALFPFRQYVHYNEEGNRLVAEEVLRSISFAE